jgi:primosomal protein N''
MGTDRESSPRLDVPGWAKVALSAIAALLAVGIAWGELKVSVAADRREAQVAIQAAHQAVLALNARMNDGAAGTVEVQLARLHNRQDDFSRRLVLMEEARARDDREMSAFRESMRSDLTRLDARLNAIFETQTRIERLVERGAAYPAGSGR